MAPQPTFVTRPRWPVWLLLIGVALAGLFWWWQHGRPVNLPDAPSSRIACVSYAPFRGPDESPLDPKAFVTPARIDADLRALSKRFDCVRTYSQSQGLNAVPAIAQRYGMKVLMGVWIGRDAAINAREIALGIASARAYPGVLRGVVVGNEVLLRGEQTPAALAVYIKRVRDAVKVPVTYADVWEYWLRHLELAGGVDFVTIHILPYWEDQPVPPEYAVEHVAQVYAQAQKAFPGKQVMIGETGWPSEGRPRRSARASLVNEALYLRDFLRYAATVHMPYNVIEAFDQPWKRVLEGTVGGYWGIFDTQAQPKFPMQGPVTEIPRWWLGWLAGAGVALGFIAAGMGPRRWRGWRGFSALGLAGIASGTALAWQVRQMMYSCNTWGEWWLSGAMCAIALGTALWLARVIAAQLVGATDLTATGGRLRLGWLFALALYGLLLVFDGRYRDFPIGLFALPCVGFFFAGWLSTVAYRLPMVEERLLACALPLLGITVVIEEAGMNAVAWLWLVLNLALALPVLLAWRRVRLQPSQA